MASFQDYKTHIAQLEAKDVHRRVDLRRFVNHLLTGGSGKTCELCGKQSQEAANFCMWCGHKFGINNVVDLISDTEDEETDEVDEETGFPLRHVHGIKKFEADVEKRITEQRDKAIRRLWKKWDAEKAAKAAAKQATKAAEKAAARKKAREDEWEFREWERERRARERRENRRIFGKPSTYEQALAQEPY